MTVKLQIGRGESNGLYIGVLSRLTKGEIPMAKRKLKDLNLLDDFLFGSMVTYPEIGEKFSRELLRTVFQREFGRLTVVSQNVYYGNNTNLHGTRLDVYLEEELPELPEDAAIYAVEPDRRDKNSNREALPRRIRFYHAKIDTRILKSGKGYQSLKKVIVLIITPYDPFTRNRMIYTIQNQCVEEPDMPYEDGAKTIFFYTKGERGEVSEELRQFLHYMEHTTPEYAVNESLKRIQRMVEIVKTDEEVSRNYMRIFDYEEIAREEGRKEEQVNTERERANAERERANAQRERANAQRERANAERERASAQRERLRAETAERELLRLQEEFQKLKAGYASLE